MRRDVASSPSNGMKELPLTFRTFDATIFPPGRRQFPASSPSSPEGDHWCLITIFGSSRGTLWPTPMRWNLLDKPDRWAGVTLGDNGRVVGLELNFEQFGGRCLMRHAPLLCPPLRLFLASSSYPSSLSDPQHLEIQLMSTDNRLSASFCYGCVEMLRCGYELCGKRRDFRVWRLPVFSALGADSYLFSCHRGAWCYLF